MVAVAVRGRSEGVGQWWRYSAGAGAGLAWVAVGDASPRSDDHHPVVGVEDWVIDELSDREEGFGRGGYEGGECHSCLWRSAEETAVVPIGGRSRTLGRLVVWVRVDLTSIVRSVVVGTVVQSQSSQRKESGFCLGRCCPA